ncbi:hypothetical protein EV715DRAFT_287792 [Schizophyllum commune]
MPTATCRLCFQDVQFPEKWLLFPNCGHAFCQSCAGSLTATCPTCHVSSMGRSYLKVQGVQINEVATLAQVLAAREDKHRLLEDLEEVQARWDASRRKLQSTQIEAAELRETVQALRTKISMYEKAEKEKEAGKASVQVVYMQPVAALVPQGLATVAVQHGLVNWQEARRIGSNMKDRVAALKPKDFHSAFLSFSLFLVYAMAACFCYIGWMIYWGPPPY